MDRKYIYKKKPFYSAQKIFGFKGLAVGINKTCLKNLRAELCIFIENIPSQLYVITASDVVRAGRRYNSDYAVYGKDYIIVPLAECRKIKLPNKFLTDSPNKFIQEVIKQSQRQQTLEI